MISAKAAFFSILGTALLGAMHSSAQAQNEFSQPSAQTSSSSQIATGSPALASAPTTPSISNADSPITRYEGLRVHDIQFRSESLDAADETKLRALLPVQPDQPLNRLKLGRSIQALYNTGRFADVQVEAERTPNAEVSLVFVAKENYFFGVLRIAGAPKAPPTPNQLINSTKLQLGELYTHDKLQAAIDRMKRVLADDGYYKAVITTQLEPRLKEQQMDVIFNIVPGAEARLGEVIVQGNSGYSVDEVRHIAKLKRGDRVNAAERTSTLQRLRKKYQKQDRLEAQVSIAQTMYHPGNNTVDYVLNIQRGAKVDIRLEGAKLRKGLIKKYVPVYEENAVDDDLLNEGRRNLRDYFQTKGYFDVNVDFSQKTLPGKDLRDVIYDVNKGERHKLLAIIIDGNHYFPTDLLRERMYMEPANTLLTHGRYSQSILSRDIQSIENLYSTNGFQNVKVNADIQDDYLGKVGHLRVVLHVNEGQQTLVQNLRIAGNQTIPNEQIVQLINSTEGQPFSSTNLAADRDSIVSYYFNHGFPDVQVDPISKIVSSSPPRMDVTYNIREGAQIFVNHVFISGLHFTRPYVVDRELRVHTGDPVSQSEMLETQRRLYDLGIFNEANIAVQNPDGDAQQKNVLLDLEEAKRYTFNYGFGLEVQTGSEPGVTQPQGRTGVSPRVSFDVSRLNFLGRDHTLTFKSRYGRLQQRALFSYEAPRWLGTQNWRLILTAFYDTTRDVRTFTAQRLEGSIEAEQKFSRPTTFLYRFTYRRVKVDPNTLAIDPNLIPLLSKPVRVGMPSFTMIRDKRDDPLDAHKGNYTTFDLGASSKIFGSEASFSRLLIVNSTYHQLPHSKIVFARSTQLGYEEPFSSSTFIPLPERFYAGGANSDRGFAINQAGPRDLQTGFPLGGPALFLNQLELRLPPFTLPFVNNNLSAVFFHDMGNVFTAPTEIFSSFFRYTQRNKQQCEITTGTSSCDFNFMSHALGGGLRYRTPIGPVRIDVGYNLNPPTFPVRSQNRFETLKHFNFFFSLGQTF